MQQIELKVDGMRCSGCSGRLKRVLEATDGVASAQVVLETKRVMVGYDAASIDLGVIHEAIKDAGFSLVSA